MSDVRSLVLFLTVFLLLTGFLVGCNPCGNEFGFEEKSPNQKLKAVVFERDCGATSGFSTQVSILPSDQNLPNKPGNVFIAKGDLKVRLKWEGNDKLVVGYPQNAELKLKRETQNGVSLRYENSF